jgi:hypothetical protein
MTMPTWICATCANHYPDQERPPGECVICSDERQWVPSSGQRWTTAAELASAGHHSDVREVEPGLLGIGVDPPVAIGQRALVIQTPEGNLLWDPPGFLDEHAVATVTDAGGLRAVSASHPHFYGSIVEWSRALGAEILLPEAARAPGRSSSPPPAGTTSSCEATRPWTELSPPETSQEHHSGQPLDRKLYSMTWRSVCRAGHDRRAR